MNFFSFAKRYLSHLYPLPFAKFHKEIIQAIESRHNKILILIPREHGKTTLLIGYVIYVLLTRKYRFILFVSSSQSQARRIASTVKIEFETNQNLIQDFGNLQGSVWQSEEITLINGARLIIVGMGTGIRGMNIQGQRPDLIILDDVETDKHHYSAVESERLKKIFYHAILNLGKNAKIIVIGTMGAKHGLLYELTTKNDWKIIKYSAIVNNKPLWPERWSLKDLERKRMEIGDVAFQREFMNELVETEQVFSPMEIDTIPPLNQVVGGIDFATGRGKDYNAFVIVGFDGKNYYVVNAIQGKNVQKFITQVKTLSQEYGVKQIYAEQNNFQSFIVQELARQGLNVIGITNTKPKHERILSLTAKVNTGVILFYSPTTLELRKQLVGYPYTQNDDLIDALEIAVRFINKPTLKLVW